MRIGIFGGIAATATIDDIVADVCTSEEEGFHTYWVPQIFGYDALTLLAVVGRETERIELGTSVVPTYPRHPAMLAAQALTTQQACGGRLTLGIGLSHQPVIEHMFGMSFEKPVRHLREYLDVLMPLINDGKVDATGDTLSARASVLYPTDTPPEVTVAALGPQALRVAARQTAGTNLAWCGPKTIREHIAPTITEAAEQAGRPAPRIIATLPVCVTDDPETARARLTASTTMYATLPSYQAMFQREGVQTTGEFGLIGSEDQVEELVAELARCGVTDFAASEFGLNSDDRARTRALMSRVARERNGGAA